MAYVYTSMCIYRSDRATLHGCLMHGFHIDKEHANKAKY